MEDVATNSEVRSTRRRWGAVGAVACVVLALGLGLMATLGADDPRPVLAASDLYRVGRQSFDLTVVASGELEAKRQVEIKCQVKQSTSILELVDEGTRVEPGAVLAKLDDTEVVRKLEEVTLDVETAKADTKAAEEALAIQKNEGDSTQKAAEVDLALAELTLSEWRDGEAVTKLRTLTVDHATAERKLTRTRRDLELSKQLYAEKFISLGELEDDEIAAIEAEAGLATAALELDVYRKYTYPKEQQEYESEVAQKRAELDRTISKNASKIAQAEAEYYASQRKLVIQQGKLDDLKAQLEATVIKAPADGNGGLVVYATSVGSSWRRGDPMAVGRGVKFGETIFVLPDTRQMVASLRVHEAMIPQVAAGQHASVTIDSRPGQPIVGTVSQIGVIAENGGWMSPDLREYVVKVDLPMDLPAQVKAALKPAMRATGRIEVGRVEDVLAVPVQAVMSDGPTRYVHVETDRGLTRREVKVGRASETLVEVVEGVSEGDRVLLRNPRPGELRG